jgi:DNA-binding transcriptional regulator YiaG
MPGGTDPPRISIGTPDLVRIRIARNWTQEDLAQQLGVSVETVQAWEEGRLPKEFARHYLAIKALLPNE